MPRRKKNYTLLKLAAFCAIVGCAFWVGNNFEKVRDFFFAKQSAHVATTAAPAPKPTAKSGPLYTMVIIDQKTKGALVAKLLEISPVYKDMASGAGGAAGGGGDPAEIAKETVNDYSFAFNYNSKKYFVSADFTGGAHCCFDWYLFGANSDGSLAEIKPSDAIATMGNVYPEGESNLVVKSGKLYLKLGDDRFAYYCGSFESSPILSRYFLIGADSLTLANHDFKDEFVADAKTSDTQLAQAVV